MFADVLGCLVEPDRDDGSRGADPESETKLNWAGIVLARSADHFLTGVDAYFGSGCGRLWGLRPTSNATPRAEHTSVRIGRVCRRCANVPEAPIVIPRVPTGILHSPKCRAKDLRITRASQT